MPLATKEIKRRLRSISNTKKITKAMELVAASKMRKAVSAVLKTRTYANAAWNIIKNLSAKTDPAHHKLLQNNNNKKTNKVGLILITSNRGLCGGFNREIIETVARYMRQHQQEDLEVEAEVFLLGKKGRDVMFKHGHEIIAEFTKFDTTTRITEVTPIAKAAIKHYLNGKYKKVVIAYTDYQTAIKQVPRIKKLLPIDQEDDELGYVTKDKKEEKTKFDMDLEYTFEPSADIVLDQMLHRLIELQVYQALLESNASEHSARMMAMRNASEAAGDMIEDLNLTFNQARQQAITSEIAEISAGAAAVT